MKIDTVRIVTGSRLHFGMLSFGQPETRQFGGLGAMVRQPELEIEIRGAGAFSVTGPMAERVAETVRRIVRAGWIHELPACEIEVLRAPRPHVGLGSGTQLALAVAEGLKVLCDLPPRTAGELAQATGRGARSAIGLNGFLEGGLLLEAGKHPGDVAAPLVARVAIPEEWRFLLLAPRDEQGLSGAAESQAFERLAPVPPDRTDALCRLAVLEILPSAALADFSRFSRALYEFGHLAGLCFAGAQGGAFSSPRVAALVAELRRRGVTGVCQSSWGPTVAAVFADQAEAEGFWRELAREPAAADLDAVIAQPANHRSRAYQS